MAVAEYQNFYDKGVTKAELDQAKKSLLSSFNLRFSTLSNIAGMLREMQRQGLGIDFLAKRQGMVSEVELEAVNRAIKNKMPKSLNHKGGIRVFEVSGK